ncbi:tetratricopeptide repeat protein [Cesiribacter andamanensis]|uniref:Invasion protein regulator n=1 Tax=Cesiribacter andamanensis AMV16 TaxID=1279009 RepID=M7NJJ4_9BACT|nr:tetratricopeptide repeat protein [Cesiribacter andamanensis]EMR01970.1 invasion protein regulator [Cesiribacter andamanensis AMV16]
MRYRRPQRLLPHIAQELGVAWILSGEVQEAGKQIQVWVRLVQAAEDRQVWAECYQKTLSADTLFEIQAQITRQIAEALQARLSREEEVAIRQPPTHDLESYCLHAQGRWSLDQRTEGGMQQAVSFFTQALARDPHYALAWVGLADALVLLYEYGFALAEEVLPQAENAVQKALALDPRLAEISTTMALLHEARREGAIAEQAYKKAIALRPNYAEAHNWLSWTSLLIGKAEQALQSAKRAVESNPLSPEALSNLSFSLLVNGEPEKAIREARRCRNLQPEWTTAPFYEGVALYHLGRYAEALRLLDQLSVPWAGTGPQLTCALAHVHMGHADRARQLRSQLAAGNDPFAVALISAALGESGKAVEQLAAVSDWNYWAVLSMHHLYPEVLGPLQADSRYLGILQQVYQSWGLAPPTTLPVKIRLLRAREALYSPDASIQP